MIHEPVRSQGQLVPGQQETSGLLRAAVNADGTAAHAYAAHLAAPHRMTGGAAMADLADAAHYLCLLHGRHPGVIDHAATRIADNAARDWLLQPLDDRARADAEALADRWALGTAMTRIIGALGATVPHDD